MIWLRILRHGPLKTKINACRESDTLRLLRLHTPARVPKRASSWPSGKVVPIYLIPIYFFGAESASKNCPGKHSFGASNRSCTLKIWWYSDHTELESFLQAIQLRSGKVVSTTGVKHASNSFWCIQFFNGVAVRANDPTNVWRTCRHCSISNLAGI